MVGFQRQNLEVQKKINSENPSLKAGFLLGIFFRGKQNLLLCKFLLLCYCFRTKFQRGAKIFRGANCLRGAPPLLPSPCGRKPGGRTASLLTNIRSLKSRKPSVFGSGRFWRSSKPTVFRRISKRINIPKQEEFRKQNWFKRTHPKNVTY